MSTEVVRASQPSDDDSGIVAKQNSSSENGGDKSLVHIEQRKSIDKLPTEEKHNESPSKPRKPYNMGGKRQRPRSKTIKIGSRVVGIPTLGGVASQLVPVLDSVAIPGRKSTILQDSISAYHAISNKLSPPGTEVLQWKQDRHSRIAAEQANVEELQLLAKRQSLEREERRREIRHRMIRKREAISVDYELHQDVLRRSQETEHHKAIRRVGRLELFGWEREKRCATEYRAELDRQSEAEAVAIKLQLEQRIQNRKQAQAQADAEEKQDMAFALSIAKSLALVEPTTETTIESSSQSRVPKPTDSITQTSVLICVGDTYPNANDVPYHMIDDLVKYIARFPMAKDFYRKFPQSYSGATTTVEGYRLGKSGMLAFSKCLAAGAYSDVKELNLGWNSIQFQGICGFAKALDGGGCAELKTLKLQSNFLGDDSIKVLANALMTNTSIPLSVIILDGNQIGNEGAISLCSLVYKGGLPLLSRLSIRRNRIGVSGAKSLLQMGTACQSRYMNSGIGYPTRYNRTYRRNLESIALTGNPISQSEIRMLQRLYPAVGKL